MLIKQLEIKGLRSFKNCPAITFSVPNGEEGSGLNILVGANNSGKSTIIEAINYLKSNNNFIPTTAINPDIEKVKINVVTDKNEEICLETINDNSIINFVVGKEIKQSFAPFILSSKRGLPDNMYLNGIEGRDNYAKGLYQNYRKYDLNNQNNFGSRIRKILANKDSFDNVLGKVINPIFDWKIVTNNNNQMNLAFTNKSGQEHSSDGVGDGITNIFNIIDALYDSDSNQTIIIDEPETSLHPFFKERLMDLLIEYSKTKQIIISTHSQYFIDLNVLCNTQASLFRIVKENDDIGTQIFELQEESKKVFRSLLKDLHHPTALSLDAKEVFFLKDNVILVEGQDDVVGYKACIEELKIDINAKFFGWGASGNNNIPKLSRVLNQLGYKKVFAIYDNDVEDKEKKKNELEKMGYMCEFIPTDDIRDKKVNSEIIKIKLLLKEKFSKENKEIFDNIIEPVFNENAKKKEGMLIFGNPIKIKDDYKDYIKNLLERIKEYFEDGNNSESQIKDKLSIDENNIENIRKAEDEIEILVNNNHSIEKCLNRKFKKINFSRMFKNSKLLSVKQLKNNNYWVVYYDEFTFGFQSIISIYTYYKVDLVTKNIVMKKQKIKKYNIPKNM